MADKKIKGITIEIGGDAKGLKKALQETNAEVGKTNKELKQLDRLLKVDPKNTELLAQKQELLNKNIGTTKDKLQALKDAKSKADEAMKNGTQINEEQYRMLQREIVQTEQEVKRLEKSLDGMKAIPLDSLAESTNKFGKSIEDVGKKVSVVSGVAAAALGAGGKMASDFEDAFAKVLTIADTTEISEDKLKKQIKNLSKETGIAATNIADNVYNAISAGQKTADAVNFVGKAVKLSKAGFTDSAFALDILTTSMNAYEMEADKVGYVSDLLIQTQNLGKTTVGELASSMGKVIPTAKANNVEMNQLCTSYAILTSNGIATAESTTYVNSMLNELGKGGSKVDKVLRQKTGKSFAQLSEEGKNLGDVLSIVSEEAEKSGKSFSDMWSSSEAGKAAIVLLGNGADDFNKKLSDMNGAVGATDTAFGKLDTTSYKIQKMLNELKLVLMELGSSLLKTLQPALESMTKKIKAFTDWFNKLNEGQKKVIVTIMAFVAVLGPSLIAIGKMAQGVSALITVVKGLQMALTIAKTATTALSTVMSGGWIAAIMLAVAAITTLIAYVNRESETEKHSNQAIRDKTKAIQENAEAYHQRQKTREEDLQGNLAEIDNTQRLADELRNLADANGNVDDKNRGRVEFILNELNNAYGTEYRLIDGQITKYGELCDSIDAFIEKKKFEAIMTTVTEDYTEALRNQEQAEKDLEIAQQNFNAAQEKYITAVPWMKGYYKDLMDDAAGAASAQQQIISESAEAVKKYEMAWNIYYANGIDDAVEYLQNGTVPLNIAASEVGKQIGLGIASGMDSAKLQVETSAAGLVKSAFDSANRKAKVNSPSKLMRDGVGMPLGEGVAVGMDKSQKYVKKSAEGLIDAAVDGAKEAAEIHSPAGKTKDEIGKYLALGVAEGIKENDKAVVDEFKKMFDKLEYLRNFDIIDEDTYYTELERLRDKYFKTGTKEWLEYTKKVYDYQKKVLENEKKVIEDQKKQLDELDKYAGEKLDKIIEKQKSYADKLKGYGDGLFNHNTIGLDSGDITYYSLHDFGKDIDDLKQYNELMISAKNKISEIITDDSISESLMSQIGEMSIDEGINFLKVLTSASYGELEKYLKGYEEKQKLADNISTNWFKGEFDQAMNENVEYIKNKLTEAGKEIPEIFSEPGALAAESFAVSFSENLTYVFAAIQEKVNQFKQGLDIGVSMTDDTISGMASVGQSISNTNIDSHNKSFSFHINHSATTYKTPYDEYKELDRLIDRMALKGVL